MEYEIVELEEKLIAGITARTSNNDNNMSVVIGELWDKFYKGGVYNSLKNIVANDKAIESYSDYEGDYNSDYSVTVGCEVLKNEGLEPGVITKVIPKGRYAKFIVKGDAVKAVQEFWKKLWNMNLDRNYKFDFEEYQNDSMDDAIINIYISIN